MNLTPFAEFAVLLLLAALVGAVFVRLRQPVLIAYIAVGILMGPAVLGLVSAHDQIALLAKIGVAVLLFIVGLKLDLHHVRHIGPVALATGLGQLAFTIVIGFGLTLLLGKSWVTAAYVAVALTFSSTIIIVKLLSDKRELDSLHGRIAIGFLIVQDLAVVLAMMGMSAFSPVGPEQQMMSGWELAASLAGRLVAAVLAVVVLMRWILPWLVASMARSQELLLIFALSWAVALAALGAWAGFSLEAGAFIAGFTLASTQYREAINSRLAGIRDFLLLFFFLHLGSEFNLSTLGDEIVPALVLSAFVLIGNPLIVLAIMGFMGYRKRTGFLAGLTVAQISEFSLVFVAMGISLGHVGVEALGLTTLVGLITITLSTYMILNSHALYDWLAPLLSVFERRNPFRELAVEESAGDAAPVAVVIFGLGRYGSRVLRRLHAEGVHVLGVDFDPEAVRELRAEGLPVRFGDGENAEFLAELPLARTQWVLSTLPQVDATHALLHALGESAFRGRTALTVRHELAAAQLQDGVDRIFLPFEDAASHAADHLLMALRAREAS